MSNSGSESEFSDEEQGAQTFSIQPYQFEPQVNTDERDINTESLSGNESMEGSEELNPRLKNSDLYVLCSLLHCNSFTNLRNKLLFGPDVVFIIVSFSFFFRFESLEYVNIIKRPTNCLVFVFFNMSSELRAVDMKAVQNLA